MINVKDIFSSEFKKTKSLALAWDSTLNQIGEAFQLEFTSNKWRWPRQAVRKGRSRTRIERSPKDIISSGALVKSQKVRRSS